MKRPKSRSLRDMAEALESSNQKPAAYSPTPRKVVAKTIGERSQVILTQNILYRTLNGKLIRPGHKTIPQGAIGIVTAVRDDNTFEIALRNPVNGTLHVQAPEIKISENSV